MLDLLDIYFRDSPDSLNGLGNPGNIWFRRFAVTYTSCLKTLLIKIMLCLQIIFDIRF